MKKNRAGKLIGIFLVMLKIGLFTFGGGYAMIALLENEFVTKKKWIGKDEFLDMIAIAESTPGPAAVNSATYLGYRVGGFPGAFLGTLAVCIPSFIIIYVISLFFDAFLSIKYVGYAFRGVQACVIYLIASAGLKLFREMKKDVLSMVLCGASLVCMVAFSLFAVSFSSVFYILIAGAVGVFVYLVGRLRKKSGGSDREEEK
ncbi:chromate transport protein ChrA [Anaerotruncus sp. CAG:390]|nr:chromate transport protein ChrA [Anaerotruncus sp. CAG:390]